MTFLAIFGRPAYLLFLAPFQILLPVEVLRTTYKNLTLLMGEMDMVGKEQGFAPLGPKFLRWKSDRYEEGWLLSDFIKIYQLDGASAGNDLRVRFKGRVRICG